MKYMLLVYLDEKSLTDEEYADCYAKSAALSRELSADGQYIAASPLHPVATATSLQIRGGKRFVTDGPFAETREQLGGYYVIDVEDLDQALAIAERVPPAKFGTIEVRPILEITGLPDQ